MNIRDFINASKRRSALEKDLKIDLSNIANFSFSEDQVKNHNIENLIGATQIPLGVAGPLKINGVYAHGDFYLPLSTTEGALVASVSRGCKTITKSGGATVLVQNIGVTRAPVFKTPGILESQKFIFWVEKNFSSIKNITDKTSLHLKLLNIKPFMAGTSVWLRFSFDTKDAMGMNMATLAVDKAVKELIEPKAGVKCVVLSGNLCVDKKPSWINFLEGRGKKVWAEAVIKKNIVQDVLKTQAEKIIEAARRKISDGSIMSGSIGQNAHFANVIAAIFCATGQDLAHVTEGSIGITTTELMGEDLYMSIYLPDLMVGTVGGGTDLPIQKEALAILGIPDEKLKTGEQVLKLAEIVGAGVLAGELSLLAALASGELAMAHQKLGRGKN